MRLLTDKKIHRPDPGGCRFLILAPWVTTMLHREINPLGLLALKFFPLTSVKSLITMADILAH